LSLGRFRRKLLQPIQRFPLMNFFVSSKHLLEPYFQRFKAFFTGITVALFVSACGGGGGIVNPMDPMAEMPSNDDPDTVTQPIDLTNNSSCDVDVQNQWAYNNMQDYYLFYDQVPNVDPRSFESTADLVRSVRFQERDPFSSLTNAATSSLQFQAGREFGLGFIWGFDGDDVSRLVLVEPNGPFGLAGLERGDIILNVNGAPFDGVRDEFVGTPDAPGTSVWEFLRRDSAETLTVEVTAAEYGITTVLERDTYTHPAYNGRLGYLLFTRFLEPSGDELREAFEYFSDRNITDLVVDLRYNGGGRVDIAQLLASLLAGNSRAGELLLSYEFNDKYTSENYDLLTFETSEEDLELSRVVFLTRGGTASASEILINGLSPHMDVFTMGSTTNGKPYIQRGRVRCGQQLNAIEAEGFNDAGVSVFGGIPATCFAFDDRTRDFGLNPNTGAVEGMLESALLFLVFGSCDAPTVLAARSKKNDDVESLKQGIDQIGGAFH